MSLLVILLMAPLVLICTTSIVAGIAIITEDHQQRISHVPNICRWQNILYNSEQYVGIVGNKVRIYTCTWCSKRGSETPGPVFYRLLNNASANERRRHICNVFFHWLRPFSAIDRKWSRLWRQPPRQQKMDPGLLFSKRQNGNRCSNQCDVTVRIVTLNSNCTRNQNGQP